MGVDRPGAEACLGDDEGVPMVKRRIAYWTAGCALLLIGGALYLLQSPLFIDDLSDDHRYALLEKLPKVSRENYLRPTLKGLPPDCSNCLLHAAGSLEAIWRNQRRECNSWRIDYRQIVRYAPSDADGGYEEPVSAQACNIITYTQDQAVINELGKSFTRNPHVVRDCVLTGMDHAHAFWPDRYAGIAASLAANPYTRAAAEEAIAQPPDPAVFPGPLEPPPSGPACRSHAAHANAR
jgi:hypothetical protein